MKLVWDNDIIHKLSALDLVEAALAYFGQPGNPSAVSVLDTAPFRFGVTKGREKAERRYGAVVHQRIAALLQQCGTLGEACHPDDEVLLSEKVGIDVGEAILISLTARDPDSLLVTGDKKAIKALLALPECAPLVKQLEGRVVCLEQILLGVITQTGFEEVKRRVQDGLGCDTVVRSAFGSGALSTEQNVVEAFTAYLTELKEIHPGFLTPKDP